MFVIVRGLSGGLGEEHGVLAAVHLRIGNSNGN